MKDINVPGLWLTLGDTRPGPGGIPRHPLFFAEHGKGNQGGGYTLIAWVEDDAYETVAAICAVYNTARSRGIHD